MLRAFILALALLAGGPLAAQSPPEARDAPMTVERLITILLAIDPQATTGDAGVQLTVADVPVLVVFDPGANRMRAMVPVASASGLAPEDLTRVLQANFDTALDARYAIANGRLWSAFIHPLRELQAQQLISGIAQTVTLAQTYGTFYASGAAVFGAGDSGALHDELLEELRDRAEDL